MRLSSASTSAALLRIHDEGAALLLVTTREDVAAVLGGRTLTLEDGRITSGDPMPLSRAGTGDVAGA